MTEYEDYLEYDEYYDEPVGPNRRWLIVAAVVVAVLLCCCCLLIVVGAVLLGDDILNELEGIAGMMQGLGGVAALV